MRFNIITILALAILVTTGIYLFATLANDFVGFVEKYNEEIKDDIQMRQLLRAM